MTSHSVLIQVHLIDYAPQGDIFRTDILPEIVTLLNSAEMAIKIAPAAGTVDDLITDLSTEPGVWQVVFYDRAAQAVEAALFAGTLPREALAAWELEMTALLGFHRQHRRSVLLVDRAAVSHTPLLFALGLSTYLDIPLPKPADAQAYPRAAASVEAVIAAQTVVQSLSAKRLNGELDASSLPIPEAGVNSLCDVDMAFQSYMAGKPAGDGAQADDLKIENDLLLLQLGTVQEELEDYFKRWGMQKQQTSDLEGKMQLLQKKGAQADAALLAVQAELVQQQKQHTTAANRAKMTATAKLQKSQAKLDAQATEQAAAKSTLEAKLAVAQDTKAENDLLLMQLGNVQEELETYFLEVKQLKTTCTRYEEQLTILGGQSNAAALDAKGLHDQLHDAERNLQEARDTLQGTEGNLKERDQNLEQARHNVTQLEAQLHQREDELHHFLQSTSWRVTGPLRRIKDRLSRSKDQEH